MYKRSHSRSRRRQLRRAVLQMLPVSLLLFSAAVLITALTADETAGLSPAPERQKRPFYSDFQASSTASPSGADGEYQPNPPEKDSWQLTLVNSWNPLPESYSVQTVELSNGLQVDERCYPDLQQMMDACRAAGYAPVICSAYRTREYQERLFQAEVERWLAMGYPQDRAESEAGKAVARPGASEHQLGLAVDIVDRSSQLLEQSQEDTPVQQWLMAHSWEYGFILRYPSGKSDITGILYEPWHYRYVGREYAEQLYTLELCLEEYLNL